ALAAFGVTTALDMGTWPPELVAALRQADGVTDIRSVGSSAAGPGGVHARIPGFPADGILTSPDQARAYVKARVAEAVDYIKVIVEAPGHGGLDETTLRTVVEEAHAHGRIVIAHASATGAIALAQAAGADVLTHAPLDAPIGESAIAQMVHACRIIVPTLVMMEGVVRNGARPGIDYGNARDTVTALHSAGVPIVVGTDANNSPGVPANVPHGAGLHRELELLVDAGLTPTEALCGATGLSARCFGLPDRGRVQAGLRADLLLVGGDPTHEITATRDIRAVWIAGRKVG
ncbi:MAG: amidohydrolase family protein, partial [Streptosporangiaceae bacterium]